MTAQFEILHAGPHVSLQDGGRKGALRYGVPASGPMDRLALSAANRALGNPADAVGVEVSLAGLILKCSAGAVTLAVAGGGFVVEHAGRKYGSWQVLTVAQGETLVIRPGRWGAWCCLAFAGDLQSPRWMNSAATHGSSGLGGGKLATGGQLTVQAARVNAALNGPIPCPVFARPRHQLRISLGPQDRFFAPETLQDLLTSRFTLTSAYDRMGVRLSGPPLPPAAELSMPSEPIARGSIQVAGDGVATVLLADHQTTGGYPKIATVLDCDLDSFAQLRPRDAVSFHAVTPDQAIRLARTQAHSVAAYLARLGS
jgi:allophanate hydrolase